MIKRIIFPQWSAPIALLAATLAGYGLFVSQQGYAWDDWGVIWMAKFLGPQGLIEYFNKARPLWGYFYVATTSLIGTDPFAWQIFALLMRWLAALGFWWCLRLTWPRHTRFAFWAAIFALLYPGFSQHSIAIAYGHYSLTLAIFFASLGLALTELRVKRAQKNPRLTIAAALILSALNLFSVEYFLGLELLRPLFIWFVVGESTSDFKPRWGQTLKHYLPYAFVLLAFVVWRGFFYESELYTTSILSNPSGALMSLPRQLADALWNTTIVAWLGAFHLPPSELMGARLTFVYWLICSAGVGALVFFSSRVESTFEAEGATQIPFKQWFALGALGLLTAGIPFYAARLSVELRFPQDRFTQPFAFAAALLLAAALERVPRDSWRAISAGLLTAFAIGIQIQYAFYFREDWELQRAYFWQLAWRVPSLQSGTAILNERPPFRFTDDDAMTFPTNWILSPHPEGRIIVQQVSLATRVGFNSLTMQFAHPIEGKLFTSDFVISPDLLLATQFAPPSCLRILDPVYDSHLPLAPLSDLQADAMSGTGIPLLGRRIAAALPASNVGIVLESSASSLPESIFGPEPDHTWCYYFEKADLARQFENWDEVARLGDLAFADALQPDDLSEYLPFIEAYARIGRTEEARDLTLKSANAMPLLAPALCALWQQLAVDLPNTGAAQNFIGDTMLDLKYCPLAQGEN